MMESLAEYSTGASMPFFFCLLRESRRMESSTCLLCMYTASCRESMPRVSGEAFPAESTFMEGSKESFRSSWPEIVSTVTVSTVTLRVSVRWVLARWVRGIPVPASMMMPARSKSAVMVCLLIMKCKITE